MGAGCSGRPVKAIAPTLEEGGGEAYCDYSGDGPLGGAWFTCDPTAEVPPRLAARGYASADELPPATIMEMLELACQRKGDEKHLMVERVDGQCPPLGADGKPPPALPVSEWTTWTYNDFRKDVRSAAKAFVKLGFARFDSVNIWGFNSPEWIIGAIAASYAGGKVAGLYPTDTGDTAAYKVIHSGASIVLIEDKGKIDKLKKGLAKEGGTKKKIGAVVAWGFEPEANETVEFPGSGQVPLLSWKALIAMGETEDDAEVDSRVRATKPGHCCALIYTSGTTGQPKAVMISHDNMLYESMTVLNLLKNSVGLFTKNEAERLVSYLPLSHVAGMMVDIACPIVGTAKLNGWQTVFFARPYDLKAGSVKDRLCAALPTIFLGVPLVWEKIADRIRQIGSSTTSIKKSIATWAKGKGLEYAQNCQLGGSGAKPSGYGIAESLVLNKVKGNLGLQECKFGFTGAAPIRVDTLEFFGSLGLGINEVYGMSECTGASTISLDEAHQWGSCGWELPGVEVRCFKVDDADFNKKTECRKAKSLTDLEEAHQGELCYRGRHIMMGYMANPDLGEEHVQEIRKKTAETIDSEGWLHSGDKGMITEAGMVKITGRYKELIIGDGGENIAPVPIEDHVKKECDGINECMMVGDKRKYNVALITLKAVGANGEVPGTDVLDAGAARFNPEVTTISAAMSNPAWIDAITKAINSANANTKVCHNNAFKIGKFTILPTNFSEENQELTPTKKLKRSLVEKRYAKAIEKLYSEENKSKTYVQFDSADAP